jgi:hypothetical protein
MIYRWEAEILATVPNHVSANDFELRNHFIRGNNLLNVEAVGKFLYFRDTDLEKPVTAIQTSNSKIAIHPGLNRFFGVSLRKTPEWIPANIFTELETPIPVTGVKWIKKAGKVKAKKLSDYALTFLGTGMHDGIWMPHWINTTKNARLELYYENQLGVINPKGDWTIKESVEDNLGIWNTVLKIVDQIDNYSL